MAERPLSPPEAAPVDIKPDPAPTSVATSDG